MGAAAPARSPTDGAPARALGRALALALAAVALAWCSLQPSASRGLEAPAAAFSAARARVALHALLGDEAPHPHGSAANAALRARLKDALRARGFQVEEVTAEHCDPWSGICGALTNVYARREGTAPLAPLVITTHHDSRADAPGAADAGAGMAVALEASRALAAGPPLRRPLVLAFTDGEEQGLMGAAPAARHRWVEPAHALWNLEARGTEGPVLFFETAGPEGALVRAYASGARRPRARSLFAAIYRAMPNDTDLTIFRRHGHRGANLAFLGAPLRYHTPRDSLEFLSSGSLQEMGDATLGGLRALDATDDLPGGPGDTVYGDWLGRALPAWPRGASLPLALLALALVEATRRRRGVRLVAASRATARALLGCALGFALAAGVGAGLRAQGALPFSWIAQPGALLAALAACGVGAAGALTLGAPRDPRSRAADQTWSGLWLPTALAGVALAHWLPAASDLFVLPALAAGLAAHLVDRRGRSDPHALAHLLPAAFAATLWVPVWLQLEGALGLRWPGVFGTLAAALAAPFLAPLVQDAREEGGPPAAEGEAPSRDGPPAPHDLRRPWCLAWGALAALATARALTLAPFTFEHPRPANLGYRLDAASEAATWTLDLAPGPLPEALARAADWAHLGAAGEKQRLQSYRAEAPALGLIAPRARPRRLDDRRVEWTLEVAPDVARLRLELVGLTDPVQLRVGPDALDAGTVPRAGPGHRARATGRKAQLRAVAATTHLTLLAREPGEVRVVMDCQGAPPAALRVEAVRRGLPPAAHALEAARPPHLVPVHAGDRTHVTARFPWPEAEG